MSALSAWQRWWVNAWPHRWQLAWTVPRFLKACPEPFRGEVLEVGAGKGWTSRRILETFPQVELTAVDVDLAILKRFARLSEKYGNRLHVTQADATVLPFDRDSFSFVVAMNVMQHLDAQEQQNVLLELLRVLRPGGLLGVSESGSSAWEDIKRLLSQEDCEVLYARARRGFSVWAKKGSGALTAANT